MLAGGKRTLGLTLLTSLVLVASAASAAEPHIYKLDIIVRGNQVRVNFALNGEVDPALAARLRSGLATSIDYDLRLAERNRYWFDQQLASHKLRITAEYDPIARNYIVSDLWDGKPGGTARVHEFAEAAGRLLSRGNLLAFNVQKNCPHKHLYVRMRASYDAGHFFALAPVDSSTDWKKSRTFKIHNADLR